jgi:hypothetical protein
VDNKVLLTVIILPAGVLSLDLEWLLVGCGLPVVVTSLFTVVLGSNCKHGWLFGVNCCNASSGWFIHG